MNNIFIISKLIIKKKLKILSDSEKDQLRQFNKDYPFSKNIDFEKITQKFTDYSKVDKNKAWESLLTKMEVHKTEKTKPIFLLSWFKYAAMIVLFIGLGYFYQQGYFTKRTTLIIPSEQITLQLDSGEIKVIDDQNSTSILDTKGRIVGNQKGDKLIYTSDSEEELLVYNTVTVPYGKRFEIQLSDGTRVNINAGSSLRFPVTFLKGESRQVFLKGEAFFDVAKDANHPFIVNADEINVRVLGTKFNISSYSEDENINTVLVEGAVVTYRTGDDYLSNSAARLKPNYKAAWHKNNKLIRVEKTDVEVHTAWLDGKLVLQEVVFNDILKKLERQYNVIFENNNKSLESRYFTAKFDVEDIYQVLESLSISGNFTYKFNKNIIIINP
ncbi:FecR family protein [Mariniflexile sp.]|uniref:FecR family protein n=1 Tax=Mariniflexile sp. TaxID=1979402 RepID=UPI0035665164